MTDGYMGKMLFVDLSSKTITEEALDAKMCRDYIGGYGIGARVLYSRQKPASLPSARKICSVSSPAPLPVPRFPPAHVTPSSPNPAHRRLGRCPIPAVNSALISNFPVLMPFSSPVSRRNRFTCLSTKAKPKSRRRVSLGQRHLRNRDNLMAEYGKQSRVACIGPIRREFVTGRRYYDRPWQHSRPFRSGRGHGFQKVKSRWCSRHRHRLCCRQDALDKLRREMLDFYKTFFITDGMSIHRPDSPLRHGLRHVCFGPQRRYPVKTGRRRRG